MPAAASLRAASSASARICSTPRRHSRRGSTAAQRLVSGSRAGLRPVCQRSTASAHRSASTGRPVSRPGTPPHRDQRVSRDPVPVFQPAEPPLKGGGPALPVGRAPRALHRGGPQCGVRRRRWSTPAPPRAGHCAAPVGGAAPQHRDQSGLAACPGRPAACRGTDDGSGTTARAGPAAPAAGSTGPVRPASAPDPGRSSTASHSGPHIRSSTAARVRNTRCAGRDPRQELRLHVLAHQPVVRRRRTPPRPAASRLPAGTAPPGTARPPTPRSAGAARPGHPRRAPPLRRAAARPLPRGSATGPPGRSPGSCPPRAAARPEAAARSRPASTSREPPGT